MLAQQLADKAQQANQRQSEVKKSMDQLQIMTEGANEFFEQATQIQQELGRTILMLKDQNRALQDQVEQLKNKHENKVCNDVSIQVENNDEYAKMH